MAEIKRIIVISAATGLILGILAGVAGLGMLVSYRVDSYHHRIKSLEVEIEDRNTRLKRLEESITSLQESLSREKYILREVEIHLKFEGDELDRLTIEKSIKEKYQDYIGREIKSIDGGLAADVIDKRIFEVGGKEYKLAVKRLVLSDVLKIWVDTVLKE